MKSFRRIALTILIIGLSVVLLVRGSPAILTAQGPVDDQDPQLTFRTYLPVILTAQGPTDNQESVRSWPPDTTPYVRPVVPEDFFPYGKGAINPGIFIVDVVVNNTNPNLTNTDTANDGETSIAVNPQNPDEIVIAAFSGSWGANAPIYHTTDGGTTWTRRLSVPAPPGWPLGCPCDWTWDYGRNNQLSAAILGISPTTSPIPCDFDSSTPVPACTVDVVTGMTTNPAQAASWNYFDPPGPSVQAQETNINLATSLGNVDQPWVLVNPDPFNPNQDNVYVAYDDFSVDPRDMRVAVSYGLNPPNFTVDRSAGDAPTGVNPGHRLAKDPNTGFVYSLFGRCVGNCGGDPKNIDYTLNRTADGGTTWILNGDADGITVANADSTQPTPKFGTVNALLGNVLHGAVDPVTGDLYYVYGNRDGATGNNRLAIRRVASDGMGGVIVGTESFVTGQVEAAIPVVAVTENGTVGVFYYTFDGFSSSDFPIFTAHLALSEDQGVTFNDSRLLTFLSVAKDDGNNRQRVLGDYMQMQTIDNCFYGSFTANGVPFGRPMANHDPIFFKVCVGPQIQVPNDLSFLNTCGESTNSSALNVCNTGTESLVVGSITSSDPQFSVTEPSSGFPVVISPDFCFPFEARFTPTGAGSLFAALTISSNDLANPSVTVQATGIGGEPDINISMADNGNFGDICLSDQKDLTLQILNQGACDLEISNISSSNLDNFSLPENLQFPLVLSPDANVDVPVRFQPDSLQICSDTTARIGDITINSDDPDEPTIAQAVSGTVPCPVATTSGELNFGQLCTGEAQIETVQVCDTGQCNLRVTGAALVGPDCDDLTLVSPSPSPTLADPLIISSDFCFGFVVKFEPDDLTPPVCNLEISTDDPTNPAIVLPIVANVGAPNLVLDPPDLNGIFAFPPTVTDPNGDLGCFSDKTLVLRNTGTCSAEITNITAAASPPFAVVAPTVFPITLPPSEETDVTIRFAPTTGGGSVTSPDETTGSLTIVSNDPGGNVMGQMCGEAVVQSGGRWLVVDGADNPIASVDSLTLQSHGINQPAPINIQLNDVSPTTTQICSNTVRFHLNREDLPPTHTTGVDPNSSYIIKAKEGNNQLTKSFTLGQCEFIEDILKLQ